jgi:hypothetical protein
MFLRFAYVVVSSDYVYTVLHRTWYLISMQPCEPLNQAKYQQKIDITSNSSSIQI